MQDAYEWVGARDREGCRLQPRQAGGGPLTTNDPRCSHQAAAGRRELDVHCDGGRRYHRMRNSRLTGMRRRSVWMMAMRTRMASGTAATARRLKHAASRARRLAEAVAAFGRAKH